MVKKDTAQSDNGDNGKEVLPFYVLQVCRWLFCKYALLAGIKVKSKLAMGKEDLIG